VYLSLRDRPAATDASTRSRGWVPATVVLLGVVSLLTDVSSEMINAVLPIYLTTQLGFGLLAFGFIDGVYQGVSASVRILGGYAADRIRYPKWIAAVGYGLSAVTRIALLAVGSLASIVAVITVDRLGKGVRTAPRDLMIANATPPAHLGRAFGVHRALDTFGAAIGPVLAFAVLVTTPDRFDAVFVVAFAFAIIGFAVLMLLVPNRRTAETGPGLRLRQLGSALSSTRLRRPLLAAGLLGLLSVGDGFLYLSLQQRDDFAVVWFPLLYVGTNVAYMCFAVPFGRLADRFGRARVFVAGHLALVAAYVAAGGVGTGTVWTVTCLILLGVFYAATDGVLAALVSSGAPEQSRGTEISAAQTVVALARFLAAVGFGFLLTAVGWSAAWWVVALSLLAAIPVAGFLLLATHRRPTEAAA
jgi:MFS family permease